MQQHMDPIQNQHRIDDLVQQLHEGLWHLIQLFHLLYDWQFWDDLLHDHYLSDLVFDLLYYGQFGHELLHDHDLTDLLFELLYYGQFWDDLLHDH